MIRFLKRWFVTRDYLEYRIDCIYKKLDNMATIEELQHQIDQLSAAVIELQKDKLVVKDGKLQRWMPDYDLSSSNKQTKE